MKAVLVFSILAVVCTFSFCAFKIGYRSGVNKAMISQVGALSVLMGTLETLHNEDVADAIEEIEEQCYVNAACLIENKKWRDEFICQVLFRNVREYRRIHARNSNEWTQTEIFLEKHLQNLDSSN